MAENVDQRQWSNQVLRQGAVCVRRGRRRGCRVHGRRGEPQGNRGAEEEAGQAEWLGHCHPRCGGGAQGGRAQEGQGRGREASQDARGGAGQPESHPDEPAREGRQGE